MIDRGDLETGARAFAHRVFTPTTDYLAKLSTWLYFYKNNCFKTPVYYVHAVNKHLFCGLLSLISLFYCWYSQNATIPNSKKGVLC